MANLLRLCAPPCGFFSLAASRMGILIKIFMSKQFRGAEHKLPSPLQVPGEAGQTFELLLMREPDLQSVADGPLPPSFRAA